MELEQWLITSFPPLNAPVSEYYNKIIQNKYLRSRVNGKFKLGLLSIINRQSLHQKGGKSRTSSSSKAVKNQEPLKTSALVSLKSQ